MSLINQSGPDRDRTSSCELAYRGGVTVDVIAVPLDDIAEAWGRQRQGPVGKLVIVPR